MLTLQGRVIVLYTGYTGYTEHIALIQQRVHIGAAKL